MIDLCLLTQKNQTLQGVIGRNIALWQNLWVRVGRFERRSSSARASLALCGRFNQFRSPYSWITMRRALRKRPVFLFKMKLFRASGLEVTVDAHASKNVSRSCAFGMLRALFEKAPVRQGRFGAKFAKRQLFFDTQIFLFRIQKVIFGIHTAVRQGFNVGFCQSKCSVVLSFGVFSSTSQVGQIDHCQRPVKHTNCLPVTFTRAKLVRPWKLPCRKSMGLVSWQCKDLFWYKPWGREIPDCLHEIFTWLPLH